MSGAGRARTGSREQSSTTVWVCLLSHFLFGSRGKHREGTDQSQVGGWGELSNRIGSGSFMTRHPRAGLRNTNQISMGAQGVGRG